MTECPAIECCLPFPYPVAPASVIEPPAAIVTSLSRLVWILPNFTQNDTNSQTFLHGDPAKVYTVGVKIRGVVESKKYDPPAATTLPEPPCPGVIVASSGLVTPNCFQFTGPVTLTNNVIDPILPEDGLNEYGLYISSPAPYSEPPYSEPAQYYMLNNEVGPFETGDMAVADYQFYFPIRGNAYVILTARMINLGQFQNLVPVGCPDNSPPLAYPGAPLVFAGQWMQMDVLSIA